MASIGWVLCTLLLSITSVSQVVASHDYLIESSVSTHTSLTHPENNSTEINEAAPAMLGYDTGNAAAGIDNAGKPFVPTASAPRKPGFRWGRALLESFVFLSIEQAYVVQDDYGRIVAENGVPFNHYWRDYKESLSTWIDSGWDDGDSFITNYIGHPIQGAMTGYIQVQNHPEGEKLEFSNSKAYWKSRFKAMLWSAAYSTQWKIGPLSEMTVEKYGTESRGKWNRDGTRPCQRNCLTGVGQVDLVVSPLGGLGWMLMEEILDEKIARRVEANTRNRFLIGLVRSALNPIRSGANILHGMRPWYRGSRDASEVYISNQLKQTRADDRQQLRH